MTAFAGNSFLRRVASRSYRAARNFPDRLLHQSRHDEIKRRLARWARPRKILVVCYGNVCRSPYLQAVLQRALPDITVTSAGFVGSGRRVPVISAALSAQRGLDLSRFRSRPLTAHVVRAADLIVVMDAAQAREIVRRFVVSPTRVVVAGDLDPQFESSRAIVDPWKKGSDVFAASFDRLDRCASVLVDFFGDQSPEARQPTAVLQAR